MNENTLLTFSTRLKEFRESRGWDQVELAKKLGTSASNISYYENMQRKPGYAIILKLRELTGESADYIMGVSDVRRLKKSLREKIAERWY